MTAHISDDGQGREESVAEHTEIVTLLCKEKGKRCGLSQVMALCGILHDMGKNKQKFNDYIHADEKAKRKLRGSIAHASTGAKYIYDMHHGSSGNTKCMVEMVSYAVAAHHGLFDCVDVEYKDIFSAKLEKVDDYEEACSNARQDYLGGYELDKVFSEASEEYALVWDKMKGVVTRLQPLLRSGYKEKAREKLFECRNFLFGCLQRILLSVLIDSDWEATSYFMDGITGNAKEKINLLPEAGGSTEEIFRKAKENFEAYMRKKQQSIDISQLTDKERIIFDARNSLQEECRKFAEHPAGIYCLPLPTGGGKTLSSLAYALEYCGRHPGMERIIYVSPYISITEQNARVFREAIGNDKWILEHHSAVIRNDRAENEDYREHKFSRYEINWEEPFICTTFVQFMNTLFSDKSESVRRMHRLANSVVIIDEVQSMPLKCVHTFNYMINFLNAVCNTDIILCTATQPALEEAKCPVCYSSPKYMIENVDGWFRKFERVRIELPKPGQKYTFEGLGEEIVRQTAEYRSILVVLNTKSAVRKLYDIIKAAGINVVYLTTNLCAEHRSDKISRIKEVLEKKKEDIVVVSTNLIEAGVDISFACVYRSMAGLDSLAQTAGRCNRNGEMEHGIIHLIMLEGENAGNMEELQQSIRVAKGVIGQYRKNGGGGSLLMPEWMDEYYKDIYSYVPEKMNFRIDKIGRSVLELLSGGFGFGLKEKKNLMNQAYKTAGQEYRVIDDYSFGVIVPYKEGTKLIESIQEAEDMEDIKSYVRQVQRYTVNVRGNLIKKFEGLIQSVSDRMPDLYMVVAPGAYNSEYGITAEWETLIF